MSVVHELLHLGLIHFIADDERDQVTECDAVVEVFERRDEQAVGIAEGVDPINEILPVLIDLGVVLISA